MSDIKNQQNISIDHSSGVKIRDVKNVVNANQQADQDERALAFAILLEKANALSNETDKQDAQTAIQKLETEAKKNGKAEEKTVRKWVLFLLETAPDIGEVAIDTFLNPIKGLSTVFQKVARRAKAEREATDSAIGDGP